MRSNARVEGYGPDDEREESGAVDTPFEFEIRRARREDVARIVQILAADVLGSQREDYRDPLPDSYFEAFEKIDADANNELMVVESGGTVVGTLQLTFVPCLSHRGGTRAMIESVHIDAAYRGRGLGHRVFEWAIARAREKGCRMVQLTTDNRRTDAHRFYFDLGFVASHAGMKLPLE
jgi:GNAT superfamily N-acetyltransferase